MTVFLRALWGPFGRQTNKLYNKHGRLVPAANQVDWFFFGIREDNTVGRWCLRYDAKERKFNAFALQMPKTKSSPIPERVETHIPDRPMVHGPTYLDILRARLSPAELAFATALSLRWKA